ncbi:hypothetical protein [Streptomyces sp. NPDC049879]|uniref:hypothetical protein n=1 Tax=Streptomyces sp. NPDC049879 TaxID=3365598 RepID=UPI00379BCD67
MTEHDTPHEGTDIGERLHLLADRMEPVVTLAGPDAARRRGERRRARRRAGTAAASVAVLAAVTAGVWQSGLLGKAEEPAEPAPPAARDVRVPSPRPTGLPWDERFAWRQAEPDAALDQVLAEWRDSCGWGGGPTETGQGSVWYYEGGGGALATWETIAFESSVAAKNAAEVLLDRGMCDYGARAGEPGTGFGVADTGTKPGTPGSARLYTALDGNRLGVLRIMVGEPETGGWGGDPYPYVPTPDEGVDGCLAGLLDEEREKTACWAEPGPLP